MLSPHRLLPAVGPPAGGVHAPGTDVPDGPHPGPSQDHGPGTVRVPAADAGPHPLLESVGAPLYLRTDASSAIRSGCDGIATTGPDRWGAGWYRSHREEDRLHSYLADAVAGLQLHLHTSE